MRIGFIWLATQNYKLLKMNQGLSDQLRKLKEDYELIKKEQETTKNRKEARANRKRLSKLDLITRFIFITETH